MAKARALDKRRKSIRNIRKITRTMELISQGLFKRAMDRAMAATAFTRRVTALVANLARAGLEVSHPLLEGRDETKTATLLVLTGNRGLCGGYNSTVNRAAEARWQELKAQVPSCELEVSGKRGIAFFKHKGAVPTTTYTQFEDKPRFEDIEVLANRYLEAFATGKLDRLDVTYTRFESIARQVATVETLLPLGALEGAAPAGGPSRGSQGQQAAAKPAAGHVGGGHAGHGESDAGPAAMYEFLPSAASILEEVVPASFKVRLFKCFLDSAVSEQVARMVAMKAATENADKMIKQLTMNYNRARQSQITGEIMEVLGGVEALKK